MVFNDNRDNGNNGKNRRNGLCHEVTYNCDNKITVAHSFSSQAQGNFPSTCQLFASYHLAKIEYIYMNCMGNCRLHPLWTDKPWLWKIYAERPEKIAFDEIIERFLFRQLVWYVPPQWNVLVSVPKFVERSRIRENDPWLCRCGEMDNLRSASVHFFFHRRRVHIIIIFLKGSLLKVV